MSGMMLRFILFFGLSLTIKASTLQYQHERIVGGLDAEPGQIPWSVSLRSSSSGRFFCSGSILNSRWILTAATCVDGSTTSELYVVAGAVLIGSSGDSYNVSKIVVHDNYQFPNYDIGLVQVEREIEFSDSVQQVDFETDNGNVEEVDCELAGWGRTMFNGELSDKLQYVSLQTITNQFCQYYWGVQFILESEICTLVPEGGRGACTGDSGSGLVCNGKIVGVLSRSYYFCESSIPNVYARVPHVAEWIEETINLQGIV